MLGLRRKYDHRTSAWATAAMSLALLLGGAPQSAGQQGGYASSSVIAHNQVGPVLEVPKRSASQSGSQSLSIPRLVGHSDRRLELLYRAPQSQTGYEQVIVTVTDQSGRYITGMQESDFRIYVDGIQRPVRFLRPDLDTPVSVGIVVDASGSMRRKIPQARMAIERFIGDLNPRDDIFLLVFSSRVFLLQPFTMNHSQVMDRLVLLRADADTALFDAIIDGLSIIERGRYEKKALLVVTDGMDNASRASLPQVVAEARRTGVLIYSIGIGDPERGVLGIGAFIFSYGNHVDAQTLRQLSNDTGARTYLLGKVGDGELLRQDCADISNELREQYTLSFVAPDPSRPSYRSLRVEVPGKPELSVRVRRGVTGGIGD
jgi:Ca-activated chloride channel homolog